MHEVPVHLLREGEDITILLGEAELLLRLAVLEDQAAFFAEGGADGHVHAAEVLVRVEGGEVLRRAVVVHQGSQLGRISDRA